MENARNAVRYTIDWLAEDHGLSREDAYILCSLAGDLRISQVVDQPNWGVSFYLPLSVFSQYRAFQTDRKLRFSPAYWHAHRTKGEYDTVRAVSDRSRARARRDGGRLPLDASQARDPGCDQGAVRPVLERPELPPALPPRGGHGRRPQPPGHRPRL